MRITCLLISLSLLSGFAVLGQDATHTSTVTLSAGGNVASYNRFGEDSGPSFSGSYEYRLWKYFGVEAGVNTIFPAKQSYEFLPVMSIFSGTSSGQAYYNYGPKCTACVLFSTRHRTVTTLLPFGVRGILPVSNGRLELFAGFGGAYAFNGGVSSYNALLGQANLGGRFALDAKRRFWLGTTLRGYSNLGYGKQTWVSWTGDFAIRFGH